MRTAEEVMSCILKFAKEEVNIRMVGMEGSRVNQNVIPDSFQDFDITFFVKNISEYTSDDYWLAHFGHIIMKQKPEDMELFPAEEPGYSYLLLFDDYHKLDLTLLKIEQCRDYLNQDKLRTILLDKDGLCPNTIIASDEDYWIKSPSERSFDDCCNEFWNIAPYVVKGLCRQEILFAIDHLYLMRNELLRMLSWYVGNEYGFSFSLGKHYKWIEQYLPKEIWQDLLGTYREDSYEMVWQSLFHCQALFQKMALLCAERFHYTYPEYDHNITKYTITHYQKYGKVPLTKKE